MLVDLAPQLRHVWVVLQMKPTIKLSIELMLNAVNLLLVAFSAYHNDAKGQVFVFFTMAVAAAEIAVGLAILVVVYRNTKSTDIDVLNRLKG